jgi:hypothetical protein
VKEVQGCVKARERPAGFPLGLQATPPQNHLCRVSLCIDGVHRLIKGTMSESASSCHLRHIIFHSSSFDITDDH